MKTFVFSESTVSPAKCPPKTKKTITKKVKAGETAGETVDWKQRAKDLEAENTKLKKQVATLEAKLAGNQEKLQKANWEKANPKAAKQARMMATLRKRNALLASKLPDDPMFAHMNAAEERRKNMMAEVMQMPDGKEKKKCLALITGEPWKYR